MKNKFILTTLFVLLLSCTEKKEFVLTGTFAQPDYEGKTVYLAADDRMENIIDSTVVANNKFTFRGTSPDSVRIAYISYDQFMGPKLFVVERGDITMAIDTSFTYRVYKIGGTPTNIEVQEYEDQFFTVLKNTGKFGEEEQAGYKRGLTKEERIDMDKKREAVLGELDNHVYNFISKNAQNALGEAIFLNDAFYMRPEKTIKLISQFRPLFQEKVAIFKSQAMAQEATSEGKKYTEIKGFDLNGKEVALSDFVGKGNIVLVDYWASWCGPCIESLPELKEFYKKNKDKGLVILGISLDTHKNGWIQASKEYGVEWPQLSRLKGWDDPAAIKYGINDIPHTILIDKDGTIVAHNAYGLRLQAIFDGLNEKK